MSLEYIFTKGCTLLVYTYCIAAFTKWGCLFQSDKSFRSRGFLLVAEYIYLYSAIQSTCRTVPDNTGQCRIMQDSTEQCSTMYDSTGQCRIMQGSAGQWSTMYDCADNEVQCMTVQDSVG
jgi:hypothetical protein